MKHFYFLAFSLTLLTSLGAQNKPKQVFVLPENISPNDYESGKLLVKIKNTQRQVFEKSSSGNKMSSQGILAIKPIVPKAFVDKVKSRQGPRQSTSSNVDLSLYYQVSYNPQQDITTVINQLYTTGYFEIVEPSYRYYQSHEPNDPSKGTQYYLDKINAYEAWDISKSNASVVIAIIDSGGDLDHPDIAPKLFINTNEIPTDGLDNDGNGFVDDVNGWDFSGAQEALIGTPGFEGDNNPSVTKGGSHSHGTNVGGCAAAATNNGIGIAGVGYNARLLFTKHYADDQPEDDNFYSSNLYQGILYAAGVMDDNGIDMKIINCSFGSSGRSQVIQDFINAVTLDLNCLVIAAAGNNNEEAPHYPAAYNNVLSVASTDASDRKSSFSNYGTWVDISTPGSSIFTTTFNDTYGSTSGTSFSCPITSGAAALVWAHNPTLTPTQVAEKLRVTADESLYGVNAAFQTKLGKGRLDVFKALTSDFPSLRASNIKIQNTNGSSAVRGNQTATLYFDVSNHLSATTPNIEISVSTRSSLITFTNGTVYPGVIDGNTKVSVKQTPFTFNTAATIPANTLIDLIVTYTDGDYQDFEAISLNLNPSYVDLEVNQLSTTVSSVGRVGYDGEAQTRGLGLQFNGSPLLYEMGLIMGTSSTTILNNVRGAATTGPYDQDFVQLEQIDQIFPGARSATEIFGKISNSATPASQQIQIAYRSMIWRDDPNDQFVILEYKLTNPTANTINNYHIGLFADWDISEGGAADAAGWNATHQIGYIYPKADPSLPHSGIQLLTGTGNHYAIDNNHELAGNPFGVYDGFADSEKFTSISTDRDVAGAVAAGNDVSHVVSATVPTIGAGQTVTVAFAIHAAADLTSLLESAEAASTMYNLTLLAPKPVVPVVEACYSSTANVSATGATSFNWYHEFTDGEPFFTGNQLITGTLYNDTTFYVSNADNAYESVRTPAVVVLKANPQVATSGLTTFCEGEGITLTALEADEYEWNTGATTQSIEVTTAGEYSVTVKDIALDCEFSSSSIEVTVNSLPVADFSAVAESVEDKPVAFTNESINAVSWLWDFGDESTSTVQNPTHQYAEDGDYEITLTVTAANGCQHEVTQAIGIILLTVKELEVAVHVYPNPTKGNIIIEVNGVSSSYFTIQLMDAQGKNMYRATQEISNGKMSHAIEGRSIPAGIYFVKVSDGIQATVKKLVMLD